MAKLDSSPYRPADQKVWDAFVRHSKNGVFLFERGYLEYHADRFKDHSLIFRRGGNVVALFPANLKGDTLQSHGGLTFGGLVTSRTMSMPLMLEVMEALLGHARDAGIKKILYKRVPHIYHSVPADEDLYALFRSGARLVRRDASSTLDARERLSPDKDRRYAIRKAHEAGVKVGSSRDFATFMGIEAALLEEKYHTKPTHSAEEMELLAGRFPSHIKLFAAHLADEMIAGVIVYESAQVAHTQYIASTKEGRRRHAVDLVLHHLIDQEYPGKRYFDFGISTEDEGRYLNEGLVEFKESFGATAVAYDAYEINLEGA